MGKENINKKGSAVSGETIKWIIYIAILIAAGIAIQQIISRAST